ncbi:MAG TPA: D-glycero-beta-D-manno-heptose-7-phosphate kinase [Flavobacteriales bacterium]|nr:D-glycero-beta-D-manno-heptose-7-phosphate kinase [Flavobacteriales bacterium]|tara:strand:- start:15984 stop:16976 length:993 start_codon:yes stop_codon:yes gene_type:complete
MKKEYLRYKFKEFDRVKALVIGDVMIDSYFLGKVHRISPEAPVPIISVDKKEHRLGGAANVALNLKSLGATPIVCSVVGNDSNAQLLMQLFEKESIATDNILLDESRVTTVKTRMIGNNTQLLRVDEEITDNINTDIEQKLIETIKNTIENSEIKVIIFEDYDKGVITPNLITEIVDFANKKGIPTTVDPKKNNFLNYKNVTLFKPNLKELKEGLKEDDLDIKNIDDYLIKLNDLLPHNISFVTLSEQGVFITDFNEKHHIPAHLRNIADVSGAGDSVISVASLALAVDMSIKEIAELANLAGGLVCEKVGVVPIEKNILLSEAIEKLAD